MVSGFDKYFQIAPCFRDEDARADRSPGEFYQLDMEMAFATQEDVFSTIEPVLTSVFSEFSDWDITSNPFPKITYKDAMLKYGTDKPDLRFEMLINDFKPFSDKSDFKAFSSCDAVRMIHIQEADKFSRKVIDEMDAYAQSIGAKGLAWYKVNNLSLIHISEPTRPY